MRLASFTAGPTKPHPKSMTLGQLAGHVAEMLSRTEGMLGGDLDFAAMGSSYRPLVSAGKRELLETFDRGAARLRSALAGKDDAVLRETWTMRQGPKVLMSMPRHAAIRANALHHVIHHRGQLTVYLRLLGVPVPATYGPTADTPVS
ncbi:MAG TPA: DinB family protein [Planctomycetota bacterium]|nr:DinB family protein [Planctomycetota bacterium]